jgi:hypothetical protein
MAKIAIPRTDAERRKRRHLRVRKAVNGTPERPRLVVFRSLKHIYAQIVDDVAQRTLLTVGDEGHERHEVGARARRRQGRGAKRRRRLAFRRSSSTVPVTSITAA